MHKDFISRCDYTINCGQRKKLVANFYVLSCIQAFSVNKEADGTEACTSKDGTYIKFWHRRS